VIDADPTLRHVRERLAEALRHTADALSGVSPGAVLEAQAHTRAAASLLDGVVEGVRADSCEAFGQAHQLEPHGGQLVCVRCGIDRPIVQAAT